MVPTAFFPKPGDFIDSSSVISQILVVSPYTGFLAKNNKKKLFSLLKPPFASAKSEKLVSTIFKNPLLIAKSNITKPIEDQIANDNSKLNSKFLLSPWPLKGSKAKAFVSNFKKCELPCGN